MLSVVLAPKQMKSRQTFKVRFRIYGISSTYMYVAILELIALNTLEIRLGERALVSGLTFSKLKNAMFGVTQFSMIRFHPLDRKDVVLWVEMDYRQKERPKEVCKEQHLSYMALEAPYS